MSKFKAGDRVECTDPDPYVFGRRGTVLGFIDDYANCTVEFDEPFDGHDCGGRVPSERGWWYTDDKLRLLPAEPEPAVVVPDGLTLRDYFAGQALIGLLASGTNAGHSYVAELAGSLADAMLAARSKAEDGHDHDA